MDIIYNLDDLAFDAKDVEDLRNKIEEYFTLDGISAKVEINGNTVHVHFSEDDYVQAEKEFERIATLCENGKFAEAESSIDVFISKHPRHSEAYRLKSQIVRQNGDANKAMDICIEALRCNPRNLWALMLMGNIFSQDFDNIDAAKDYYDKVLTYYPDNMIALNNIAAVNAQKGDVAKAKELFKKVISLDPTYENAYYGLANAYYGQKKFEKAFEIAREGCVKGKRRPENPEVTEEIRKIMLASAQAITEGYNYNDVFLGIKDIIEEHYHADIRVEEDDELKVYAQLQYGPTRGRSWHLLRYNPKRPFVPHLLVHELMHLDMMLEDNESGLGAKVVYSSNDNEASFRSKFSQWYKQLIAKIGHTKATDIIGQVHNGLMLQSMNCPLDLFVEQRMFDKYKIIRPIQLLSLFAQEQENIRAIEGTMKASFIPAAIVRASKIMNIVTSMHFEHLFGIRLYQYYKPTKNEFDTAKELYEEYQAYNDAKPGEEYDLITYFAQTLDLDKYLTISPEDEYIKNAGLLKAEHELMREEAGIEDSDSQGNSFDGLTEEQKKNQDNFYEKHKDGEDPTLTMMMSMYMLSALRLFDKRDKSLIKEVAFEIAMIGTKGISPERQDYVVKSLGNKTMGGYQLLAYYYVSWKLFNPELHKTLALPFDQAYKAALQMFEAGKEK
jgi:tetratricopeptide (TPR) repeat protein